MKVSVLDIEGKIKEKIQLPKCFSQDIREDIIAKVIEAKKKAQPYASMLIAGKQYSASGKLVHRRHVWKSQYGRGISRIPRKIFMRRGSQFNWEGATAPNTRGGRRAHPPKVESRLKKLKINKKEMKLALYSALSATANFEAIKKRYSSLKDKDIKEVPFVVDSKITSLKVKELLKTLKKILGNELFNISIKKKKVRSGKGKLRGRRYKSNAGLLFVIGNKETLKTTAFDVKRTNELSVIDLAKGGKPGRLTIYTKEAIKDLEEKIK